MSIDWDIKSWLYLEKHISQDRITANGFISTSYVIFNKGNNSGVSLFASIVYVAFLKWDLLLEKRICFWWNRFWICSLRSNFWICSLWSRFFPLRVAPHWKGRPTWRSYFFDKLTLYPSLKKKRLWHCNSVELDQPVILYSHARALSMHM